MCIQIIYDFFFIVRSIKNADLVDICLTSRKSSQTHVVFEKICSLWGLTETSARIQKEIMSVSRLYCLNLNRKWKNSSRARHRFEVNNETWLQQEIKFPKCIQGTVHYGYNTVKYNIIINRL